MRRFTFSLLLAAGAVAPCLAGGPIAVLVDGSSVTFDQRPVTEGGRVLVPLRAIFERLGAEVRYDRSSHRIRATKGITTVLLTEDSRKARIGNRGVMLDEPAKTIGGRLMVPLRFVSEALGADVRWSASTRTISITSNGSIVPEHPRILQVTQNADHPLRAGETLNIVMNADPGGQAWIEIPGAVRRVELRAHGNIYRGSWTVPIGIIVNKVVMMAHLERNGQESEMAVPGVVTVDSRQTDQPRGQFSPLPGSSIPDPRPTVSAVFTEPIRFETARLSFDNQDVTQGILITASGFSWTPPVDVPDGPHRVSVHATAVNGQPLRAAWTFDVASGRALIHTVNFSPDGPFIAGQTFLITVRGAQHGICTIDIGGRTGLALAESSPGVYQATYTVSNSDRGYFPLVGHLRLPDGRVDTRRSPRPAPLNVGGGSGFFLHLTNPSNGQPVGPSFEVRGQAFPYAHLQMQVSPQQSLLPGVIAQGSRGQASGNANAQGYFDVVVSVPNAGLGSRLSVSVRAYDDQGHAVGPEVVQVIRQ
jgi:hypothetical protein